MIRRASESALVTRLMQPTCDTVDHMSKMIQGRNVPDEAHREARAAGEGLSLSAYVLRELERPLDVPPIEETLARLRSLEPVESSMTSAEMIREIRGPL